MTEDKMDLHTPVDDGRGRRIAPMANPSVRTTLNSVPPHPYSINPSVLLNLLDAST